MVTYYTFIYIYIKPRPHQRNIVTVFCNKMFSIKSTIKFNNTSVQTNETYFINILVVDNMLNENDGIVAAARVILSLTKKRSGS